MAYLAVAAAFAYPIRRSLALVLASRRWLARIVVIVATLSVALMGLDLASIGEPGRFGVVTDDWTAFERELVIGSFPSNVRRLH